VALPGIGPWTAEIYLLTAMGSSDAWPAGDLALQSSAQHLFALEDRPDSRRLTGLAEPWRPWRAAAARLLWSHYRMIKNLPQTIS
jgi:DNA-3-methyladenine glycosylase II